jgi:hypothetical protein
MFAAVFRKLVASPDQSAARENMRWGYMGLYWSMSL